MKDRQKYIEKKLHYYFQNLFLLEQALTHSSFDKKNNERIEFLGDSLLGFVIAESLYNRFPYAKEGVLSQFRSSLVEGKILANFARKFNLGKVLLLGSGEIKNHGYNKSSILENVFEAIIGAIFLDSNFDTCRFYIQKWYKPLLENISIDKLNFINPKSRLQEFLQKKKLNIPNYHIIKEYPLNNFYAKCIVNEYDYQTIASSTTKKKAKEKAAQKMLNWILNVKK